MRQYGYQKPDVNRQRTEARRERIKARHKEWSPARPQLPQHDELFAQAMGIVNEAFKGKTLWMRADQTGLSVSTVSKHRQLKTQYPRLVSVQMQLKAIGYELRIEKIKRN